MVKWVSERFLIMETQQRGIVAVTPRSGGLLTVQKWVEKEKEFKRQRQ